MKKAKHAGTDPFIAILDWRNTLTQGMTTSPSQRLMNQRTKTLLSFSETPLKPTGADAESVKRDIRVNKKRQETNYNVGSRSLPKLHTGDQIRLQRLNKKLFWKRGIVEIPAGIRHTM